MQENAVSAIPFFHQFMNPMQTMAAGIQGWQRWQCCVLVMQWPKHKAQFRGYKWAALGQSRLYVGSDDAAADISGVLGYGNSIP